MNEPVQHSARLMDYLKAWLTYLIPHHFLSRLMHSVTRYRTVWLKSLLINWFIKQFQVDMSLAQEPDPDNYACFNDFFTRALRADVRPIDTTPGSIVSPVDGAVSQLGKIKSGRIFQAKGLDYSLLDLLGGNVQAAEKFTDGDFATLYLSPRDYHRIHMPMDGRLHAMTHVPGRLFSVNPATTRAVPRLFARNERVIAYFDTDIGPMALVMVGAIFVASIETVWAGEVTPPAGTEIRHWSYDPHDKANQFQKGSEIGRFNMGSTVIQLHPAKSICWQPTLQAASPIRMGYIIATREN